MKMPSYTNRRDTIISPGDAIDLDLKLVDFMGFPIPLATLESVSNLRFTIVSEIGGWYQTAYNSGTSLYNSEESSSIQIVDAEKGEINLHIDGGVLVMLSGYNYYVQIKSATDPDTEYKTVAKGNIEIFNQ